MEITLSTGTIVEIPLNEILPNPQTQSLEWLKERAENRGRSGSEETMKKDLADYADGELYAELDKCGVEKARLGRRRDQYSAHTRRYWDDRRKQVAGELRRRKLPVRRRGSRKALATAAHLAARRREAREAAA